MFGAQMQPTKNGALQTQQTLLLQMQHTLPLRTHQKLATKQTRIERGHIYINSQHKPTI